MKKNNGNGTLIAILFLILILPLRGIMNDVSRIDFISQRLDDYPRMRAIYLQETEEWWNWWLTEDYEKRAQQAALIFTYDEKYNGENEKLASIARTLGAEKAQIVSPEEYKHLLEQASIGETAVCSVILRPFFS